MVRPSYHHAYPGTAEKQINETKKKKSSIDFEQAGNCLRHHYHYIPFAERDKTRIRDLLCCIC
jgi:hypothetical protein